MSRYSFDEVRAALDKEWGFSIQRGDKEGDGKHDGRWDVTHSKTGYIVSGNMPGLGYRHRYFRSLSAIVRACELAKIIEQGRRP